MKQKHVIEALLSELAEFDDCRVEEIIANPAVPLVAVESKALGIASWAAPHPIPDGALPEEPLPRSAKELAKFLLHDNAYHASLGLAAFKSLLAPPPPRFLKHIKAQELILQYGHGKNVAVIGHFPFVEQLEDELARLWVLEKQPRSGDLPWEEASSILPQADLVAISSTTIANGTLADILQWCAADAKKILLGPSTPLVKVLFDVGLDVLGGILTEDGNTVKRGIREGLSFKRLRGVEYVVWEKSERVA